MTSRFGFLDADVVAVDFQGRSATWKDLTTLVSREAGALRGSASGWSVSASEDKWDSMTMVLLSLLEGRNVLFAGPMFPAESREQAVRILSELPIDHAMAFLTSGSTGRPKVVVHSQESILMSAALMINALDLAEPRVHHFFPANYMAGVLNCTVLPLVAGGTVCLDGAFDFSSAMRLPRALETMQSNTAWLSPRMVSVLERVGAKARIADVVKASWDLAIGATGALSSERRTAFVDAFGVPLHNSYGTTEHMFISVEREMTDQLTCGLALEGVSVRIAREPHGQEVDEGIVEVQTPTVARVVAEASDIVDPVVTTRGNGDWTRTGDLGYISKSLLNIQGRMDDVVVLGGLNVSTRLVESVLAGMPHVDDVCCFSFDDGRGEQRLGVALEVSEEGHVAGVSEAVRDKMVRDYPPEARPRWIQASARLPRTVNGKVDRQHLQQLAREQSRV